MADVGVCNPSGCYGKCPTSTVCFRKTCPCDGAPCTCNANKTKDFINQLADDLYYFKDFFKLLRSSPRLPNKPSQMPKGQQTKGSKNRGTGGENGDTDKSGGLFDNFDSDDYGMEGEDGDGDGGKSRRPKPSKEARLRNKLNALFDDALRNGLLNEGRLSAKDKKKLTPEYYKNVLNISVSCVQDCEPICCDEE